MKTHERSIVRLWLAAGTLLLISLQTTRAERLVWQTDLQKAAEVASAQGKPMLVQVGASWCTYCKKMHEETFQDAHVIGHMNACFIPVTVDADQHRAFVNAVGVRALPTTVIISPDMRVVHKITGYKSARDLHKTLGRFCHHN